jgi:hypothetical protein
MRLEPNSVEKSTSLSVLQASPLSTLLIEGICENIPVLEYPIDNFKRV